MQLYYYFISSGTYGATSLSNILSLVNINNGKKFLFAENKGILTYL